jgi:hypothetical protein
MPMFRPEHEEIYDKTHRTLNSEALKMYSNPEYAKQLEKYIEDEEYNRKEIINSLNKNIVKIQNQL